MRRRDNSDTNCSCCQCGSAASCSCTGSCSCSVSRSNGRGNECSCSSYSSCYYTSTTHGSTRTCGRHDRTFAFSKEMILEAPQLLRLRVASSASDKSAAGRTGSGGESCSVGPPPPLYQLIEPNKHEISTELSLRREDNPSVAIQTQTIEITTRSTSPVPRAVRDSAVLTDMDALYVTNLETRVSELSTRNESLQLRYAALEMALAAAQEQLKAQNEDLVLFSVQREVNRHRQSDEIISASVLCYQMLRDNEEGAWTALCARAEQEVHELRASHAALEAQSALEWSAQRTAQLLSRAIESLYAAEEQRRADVTLDENDRRDELHKVQCMAAACQREVFRCTEWANAVAAEKDEKEKMLREALEREKELRLQYLHVLRLPTTTIEIRPSRDEQSKEESDGDANMSVHARFVRAHREAVNAVRAQRRRILL